MQLIEQINDNKNIILPIRSNQMTRISFALSVLNG